MIKNSRFFNMKLMTFLISHKKFNCLKIKFRYMVDICSANRKGEHHILGPECLSLQDNERAHNIIQYTH